MFLRGLPGWQHDWPGGLAGPERPRLARRGRHVDGALELARPHRRFGGAELASLELGLERGAVDLLEQAALAAVVDLRLVVVLVAEGRGALHELAALAELALEDHPQVARVLDDVRRDDDEEVLLEDRLVRLL